MLMKVALAMAMATSLGSPGSVPADLSVDAFTAKALNNAVQQALGEKAAAELKKFTLNFANNKDLRSALTARIRRGPIKVYFENECAIPLLEVKAGNGHDIDALAKLVGKSNFDAISKPAPIGPCPVRP